jgi:hypothetical protein
MFGAGVYTSAGLQISTPSLTNPARAASATATNTLCLVVALGGATSPAVMSYISVTSPEAAWNRRSAPARSSTA